MRISLSLALGLLGAAQAGQVAVRQNPSGTGGGAGTTPTPTPTTPSSSPSPTTPSSTPPTTAGDTTVTVTRTVTGSGGGDVTQATTLTTTVTTTVLITSTVFSTTTVTSSNADTATKTVYETSTQWRGAPGLQKHHQKHQLLKRATITDTVTVTEGGSGGSTVVNSVTKTIRSTKSDVTTSTSIVTETEQANFKTTITVTSTLVVTSTSMSSGSVETETSTATGGASNGGDSSGLSTGAKAGIGVGAGIAGLAIIGAIIFFCLRRRRSPKPDHDDFMGASEVPVGPSHGGSSRTPMSESTAVGSGVGAAGYLAPGRNSVKHNTSPEGYRGTAMGDGRAGYAKPQPYGAAYAQTSPNATMTSRNSQHLGDALPRHPTPGDSVSPVSPNTAELGSDTNAAAARWNNPAASEIDSHQVTHPQSGPVYEMPGQPYR
ncbi:hypothetical protein ACCO45_013675 [Purpureocillium lilacinum]|uniref:Uncharacterized protein n=1 Tax=Purpureocillium lilacinum TaxID=33203 RepID=A0ACC4D792_PURLI